jgi:predicted DNA-binding protein
MEEKKRKTHTSSAVKYRYNSKTYGTIGVQLPKELVAEFKAKCSERGVSQAQVVREAVEAFLKE